MAADVASQIASCASSAATLGRATLAPQRWQRHAAAFAPPPPSPPSSSSSSSSSEVELLLLLLLLLLPLVLVRAPARCSCRLPTLARDPVADGGAAPRSSRARNRSDGSLTGTPCRPVVATNRPAPPPPTTV